MGQERAKEKEILRYDKPRIEKFEKFIQKEKFSLIEQLAKNLAQISIIGLLFSSKDHREQFLEIITKAQVRIDLSLVKFYEMKGQVIKQQVIHIQRI